MILQNKNLLLGKIMYRQTFFILCLIFLPLNVWGLVDIDESYPNPELKADKVVSLQILAMQQNDEFVVQ